MRHWGVWLLAAAFSAPGAAQTELPPVLQQLRAQVRQLNQQGHWAQAIELSQRALALAQQTHGRDNPETGFWLNQLAAMQMRSGAYEDAEDNYSKAVAVRERALGPHHPDTAASLTGLGRLLFLRAEFTRAEAALTRALAIRESALGPDHLDTASTLRELANLYRDTGVHEKAEPMVARALEIHEKQLGPEHRETLWTMLARGLMYRFTGALDKAEALYLRALALHEKVHGPESAETASAVLRLAALYGESMADFARAEPLAVRALAIYEKTHGAEHPQTTGAVSNLGTLYLQMGDFVKAESFYVRALATREKVLGPEHTSTGISLLRMAMLYVITQRHVEAEPLLARAATIFLKTIGPEHPTSVVTSLWMGQIYLATARVPEAISLLAAANDSRESNRTSLLALLSEARRADLLSYMAIWFDTFVSISLEPASGAAAAAFGAELLLRYKGRALDASTVASAHLRSKLSPQDRELLARLTELTESRARLALDGAGSLSPERRRQRVAELAQQHEQLQTELSARSVAAGLRLGAVRLLDVQRQIPMRTALIEWVRYHPVNYRTLGGVVRATEPARYAAYVLTRDEAPRAFDLGPAAAIDERVRAWRMRQAAAAGVQRPNRHNAKLAEELHATLVEPLLKGRTDVERLLLSPDSELNLVPFAALRDRQGRWLGERFELSVLTSGRDLLRLTATASAAKHGGDWIFAYPDYGLPAPQGGFHAAPSEAAASARYWGPLKHALTEAGVLKKLLGVPGEQVLTHGRATKSALKEVVAPRILHIATHGFFTASQAGPPAPKSSRSALDNLVSAADRPGPDPQPLLRSGLVLAGANATPAEGILTAAEAAQLNLTDTELITLSACDTAVGELRQGEGVYGLRRALTLAGAKSQLASLWKVDDQATQLLMTQFYRRLLRGEGRAAALRGAQGALRRMPAYADTYYWAAFVLVGDWRPLTR